MLPKCDIFGLVGQSLRPLKHSKKKTHESANSSLGGWDTHYLHQITRIGPLKERMLTAFTKISESDDSGKDIGVTEMVKLY